MAKRGWAKRMSDLMTEYAYWVTIGAVIAVIAGSAIYTRGLRETQETGIQAAAEAPEAIETPTPLPAATPLPTIAPLLVSYAPIRPGGSTVWPVDGRVLRTFDAQELVYWEALGCYQTHPGLDIAGAAGEEVRCAMDGTVTGAVHDALWDWRVTVEQTNGRTAVYAGLHTCTVLIGQNVTRGQALGTLLEKIPCEAEMEPHLHMELYRDGIAQDPESMMPE